MTRLAIIFTSSMLVSVFASTAGDTHNPIYNELVRTGIKFNDGSIIQLPQPSMTDDSDRQTREKVLKQVADRHSLSKFLLKSRVAPFVSKIDSLRDQNGNRTGQSVNFWFVAYGDLSTIDENRLFDELGMMEPPKDSSKKTDAELTESRDLTPEELKARGIVLSGKTRDFEEHFGTFDGTLLNRVQLSGVMRTAVSKTEHSIIVAAVLDSRFANDQEFPNRWRSITKNELGRTEKGAPEIYEGFGGYTKFTPLDAPDGAILVECHVAFSEPKGWFNGKNLLRPKLHVAIQNNIREFRTKLIRLGE